MSHFRETRSSSGLQGTPAPVGRRTFLRRTALLGLSASVSGCVRALRSEDSNILRIRSFADIQTLDPAFLISEVEDRVLGAIQNKLIAFKPGRVWDWELQAAQSIEKIDDTHIKFTVRPGIQFTGGFGELEAKDVKFSFERVINPELGSPNQGDWGPLLRVDVLDRYTGVIVLGEPFEPVWRVALPYFTGSIISQQAMETVGDRSGVRPPCCSGPYVLKEFVPKQRVVLARNDLWSGRRPDFDEIHIFPIEDEKTAEIAFEAGDLDFTKISLSSFTSYRRQPPAGSTVVDFPSLRYIWLGMNLDHPRLRDPAVRRAIQLAVNVNSILKAAYDDVATPATGIVAPGLIGHRTSTRFPPRGDIEAARELLSEAGYNEELELTLDLQNTTQFVTIAQVIQSNLAEAGIRVQINLHELGSFTSLGSEAAGERWRDIQLFIGNYAMVPDPFYATEWFTREQVGIWNWQRYRDPEFDRLHRAALRESDPAERAGMYQRMQDLMEESGAFRFITHGAHPVIYRDTIVPALRPDGIPLLRHFRRA